MIADHGHLMIRNDLIVQSTKRVFDGFLLHETRGL